MEKIATFIYCLAANNIQEPNMQSINANGILSAITPEYIPGTFSFSLIFTLLGLEEKNYGLNLKFKNPDGKIVLDTGEMVIPYDQISKNDQDKILLPPEETGLTLSLDLKNVVFEKNGYYITEVTCNGRTLGEYKIYAKGKNT